MNAALTGLIWHLLAVPRSPDALTGLVRHIANVHPDAISRAVNELWAVRLVAFQDGCWVRMARPILHLTPTYHRCGCGRLVAVEIRRCRRCEEVRA